MPPIPETVCEYRGAGADGDKFPISAPRTVILTKVRTQIVKGYFRQAGSVCVMAMCGISARSRAPSFMNWALTFVRVTVLVGALSLSFPTLSFFPDGGLRRQAADPGPTGDQLKR
ncbi:hypothetical protein GCM10017621_09400 [Maricaulis virginensis]|uniref:Uncharacterized protein n=1 Tax=Maricaulis virginensis TaxID=144022 RepID=A0A9W6MMQ9_9PROT|nr:hypothetical protein GCM10017621_09400 [Maricaulis virginensis]